MAGDAPRRRPEGGGLESETAPAIAGPRLAPAGADERPLLREALAGLRPDDSALRAQLLIRLAAAETRAGAPDSQRERLCRDAVAMARRLGDDALIASLLDAGRRLLWQSSDVDRRLATAREILRHAQAANAADLELRARQWLVCDHLERGDVTGAEAELRRHVQLARGLGAARSRWRLAHWRAMEAYLAGRFADAERALRHALAAGRRSDPVRARRRFAVALFPIRRDQGRLVELLERVPRLLARGRLPLAFLAGLALLHSELGQRDQARGLLSRLAQDDFASLADGATRLSALCACADVSAALGDTRVAATLYRTLEPSAGRNAVIADVPVFLGCVSDHLGRLAATLGRLAEAEAHLQCALTTYTRLAAHPLEARTRLDLGALLLRRAGETSRGRAAVHLAQARALARAIGMPSVEGSATGLLARLGADGQPGPAQGRTRGLV